MIEQTLIILKPGCIQRGIIGEIISRFERKGLKLIGIKMMWVEKALAEKHYREHVGKEFYNALINYITSSPVILIIIEGENAINFVRKITGATNLNEAIPGTIRGDYALHTNLNLVHASDSIENANREINLFFNKSEIINYQRDLDNWI